MRTYAFTTFVIPSCRELWRWGGLSGVGRILGHSRVVTTAHYSHLGRETVREAAVGFSDSIAVDIPGYVPACIAAGNAERTAARDTGDGEGSMAAA